jgi:hypothetical protein
LQHLRIGPAGARYAVAFEARVRAVAHAIEAYLADHPHAKDTRGGIRGWWLPPEYRDVPDIVLNEALADLVRRGAIVAHARSLDPESDPERLYSAPSTD